MSISQWSTTAANNATADPSINWKEGQAPSTVNDSARAMMAALAVSWQNGEWQNQGDTPTYVSGTQFTVPTNRTSVYVVGRRVRTTNTGGTVYGTISASVFTSLTTVTITADTGALDSGLSEVDVSIINPANSSIGGIGNVVIKSTDAVGDCMQLVGNGSTTPNKYVRVLNGNFQIVNSANNLVLLTLDDSGNLTAQATVTGANITGSSDERLKTGWESLPSDFIERLASVKSGTYERIDTDSGARHAGVSAQSLREVLPEVVLESAQGMLSVAYGNAALVACVELAKEVIALKSELAELRYLSGL